MFINDTLKTKLVFWRKSTRSTFIRSDVDVKPVSESDAPTFANATTLPLSSKARKRRLFSTLTHSKKTSLDSIFETDHAIQIPTVVPCTTSVTPESSGHTPDVLEDDSLPVVPLSTEHLDYSAEFGLLPSPTNESSSREDSFFYPDPPGSRTAFRVASLRMRTAAIWASIPSTMDEAPDSCEYSEPSTPVKSRADSPQRDETTSVDRSVVYSPSFSSPATSVTAVSECGLREHASAKLGIDHKPEWSYITPNILSAVPLEDISLGQSPEFPALVAQCPPESLWIAEGKPEYDLSDPPASGCGLPPDELSSSLEGCADQRAIDSQDLPANFLIPHTLSNTAVCLTAAQQPLPLLHDVQPFTNSEEDLSTSSIRSLLSPFRRPPATEFPPRPWSCAKITRAKTKRASRKEFLRKRGFFRRISLILEAGPQKDLVASIEAHARVAQSSAL